MLHIKILIENKPSKSIFKYEHGLSFHIHLNNESKKRQILFDTGSSNHYIFNAEVLNVDLQELDYVFLSHGHYDHGGGLKAIFPFNKDIYISPNAFDDYFGLPDPLDDLTLLNKTSRNSPHLKYIGLDIDKDSYPKFIYTKDLMTIEPGVKIIYSLNSQYPIPSDNSRLLVYRNHQYLHDDFRHEQSLLIKDEDRLLLVAGCAHRGILNIIQKAQSISDQPITHVISGLHLKNIGSENDEPLTISNISDYFNKNKINLYTGHCTGDKAFMLLKEQMGSRLHPISSGSEIII